MWLRAKPGEICRVISLSANPQDLQSAAQPRMIKQIISVLSRNSMIGTERPDPKVPQLLDPARPGDKMRSLFHSALQILCT